MGENIIKGENDIARFDWWRRFEKIVYLVLLELRCFSSMLPSMPKGEIVSMNIDAIGEHCRTLL